MIKTLIFLGLEIIDGALDNATKKVKLEFSLHKFNFLLLIK